MDIIYIKELEVFAHHGVFEEETRLGQKFLVNAALHTDTRKAGVTDDLTKSIHYGEVCQEITRFMQENTYQLIEAVAEQLAEHLLLTWPMMKKIDLEILKPWAPIGLPLKTVSVKITRGWHKAYLAVGSNLGNKKAYIKEAIEKLDQIEGVEVDQISNLIETEPYGGVEQDTFLNGCLSVNTLLTPMELLQEMNRIEAEAGRKRLIHWGPRTLDLDMIFYDNLVLEDERLILPHPDMQNRVFVLEPLAEICPYKCHPISGKRVKEMLLELSK